MCSHTDSHLFIHLLFLSFSNPIIAYFLIFFLLTHTRTLTQVSVHLPLPQAHQASHSTEWNPSLLLAVPPSPHPAPPLFPPLNLSSSLWERNRVETVRSEDCGHFLRNNKRLYRQKGRPH